MEKTQGDILESDPKRKRRSVQDFVPDLYPVVREREQLTKVELNPYTVGYLTGPAPEITMDSLRNNNHKILREVFILNHSPARLYALIVHPMLTKDMWWYFDAFFQGHRDTNTNIRALYHICLNMLKIFSGYKVNPVVASGFEIRLYMEVANSHASFHNNMYECLGLAGLKSRAITFMRVLALVDEGRAWTLRNMDVYINEICPYEPSENPVINELRNELINLNHVTFNDFFPFWSPVKPDIIYWLDNSKTADIVEFLDLLELYFEKKLGGNKISIYVGEDHISKIRHDLFYLLIDKCPIEMLISSEFFSGHDFTFNVLYNHKGHTIPVHFEFFCHVHERNFRLMAYRELPRDVSDKIKQIWHRGCTGNIEGILKNYLLFLENLSTYHGQEPNFMYDIDLLKQYIASGISYSYDFLVPYLDQEWIRYRTDITVF